MHKTRKSIAKRFKVTGSGKVMRRTPGMRHLMRKLTKKQRRRGSRDKSVSRGVARCVKIAAPGKF